MYVCTRAYVCVYVCMRARVCACVCACMLCACCLSCEWGCEQKTFLITVASKNCQWWYICYGLLYFQMRSTSCMLLVVLVVASSSLAGILGECLTIHPPAVCVCFLGFFFKVEISSHSLIPPFMPGSVQSDSAS